MASYEAFRLRELDRKIPCTIESIATAGNLFFVGSNDGKLSVHSLSSDRRHSSCLCTYAAKRKDPIRAVVPIAPKNLLVVVTDDTIRLYRYEQSAPPSSMDETPKFELQEMSAVNGLKDIVAIHVKKQKGIFSMAVLQRKKISIYEYKEWGQKQEFSLVKDGLLLPDGAKSLLWAGRNIIISLKREYVLLDVASGTLDFLHPTSNRKGPGQLLLSLDPVPEVLVDGEGGNGIRALHDGTILSDAGGANLVWRTPPGCAAYIHPFVVTIHSDSGLEVRLPFLTGQSDKVGLPLSQSIDCMGIERISQRPYADFDVNLPTKNTPRDAFRSDITVVVGGNGSGSSTAYLLELVPPCEQVLSLIAARRFEAGVLICQLCVNEIDESITKNMLTQFALWCFYVRRDVKTAILRFRDARADPRLVISLFPGFLTRRACEMWRLPLELSELLASFSVVESEECSEELADILLDYLVSLRPEYVAPGAMASVYEGSNSSPSDEAHTIIEAIDTAVLKAYLLLGQEENLLKFLCGANISSPDESEIFLREGGQWVALVSLWRHHGHHEKSLQLLRSLAVSGRVEDYAGTDGARATVEGNKAKCESVYCRDNAVTGEDFDKEFLAVLRKLLPVLLSEYNDDSNGLLPQSVVARHLRALTGDVEDDAAGFTRLLHRCIGVVTLILYCRQLPWESPEAPSLIEGYALWILANVQPKWSVMMFPVSKMVEDQHIAVLRLVSLDIAYLGSSNPHERIYEWLSLVLRDRFDTCTEAVLHNAYWKSLSELVFDDGAKDEGTKASLVAGLTVGETEENVQQRRRNSLCEFLRSSPLMDATAVCDFLELPHVRSNAFVERAIVYQRLKRHSEAIRMFLYEMKHLEGAKNYAAQASRSGDDVLCLLLKELLQPTNGSELRLQDAINVLNSCEDVQLATALPLLPDTTPISAVENFLRRSLSLAAMRNRSAAIYASVLEARVQHAKRALEHEKSKCIVMDVDSSCGVCGKKLRPGTVFARFPNNVLVHQACMGDANVCPVTHTDLRWCPEAVMRKAL
uniref:CNH domain-containing protein n=1 Tax=Trypanosoma congolense (strain IL3000) TaxID=1068625 RepID=G0UJ79_TRYCI|nr:conserved hypothetical protein [Trypanosoma congolense IL3000]